MLTLLHGVRARGSCPSADDLQIQSRLGLGLVHNRKCTLKSCRSRLYIDVGCIPQRLSKMSVWTARTRGKCKWILSITEVQGTMKSDIILEPTSWIFISIAYHSSYYINPREVAEGKRRSPLGSPHLFEAMDTIIWGAKTEIGKALQCFFFLLQFIAQSRKAHFCGTYIIHARPGS